MAEPAKSGLFHMKQDRHGISGMLSVQVPLTSALSICDVEGISLSRFTAYSCLHMLLPPGFGENPPSCSFPETCFLTSP